MGWGKYAVILFAALALGAQAGNNRAGGEAGTGQSAQIAAKGPAQAVAPSRPRNEGEQANPYQRDPYAKERNEREKRDIEAQEATASWAKAAFWAMMLQTIVASGALIALLCDLRQNRTNAEKQLRAYVHLTEIRHGGLTADQPFTARGHIFNKGQTPAYKVIVKGRVILRPLPVAEDAFVIVDDEQGASVSTLAPGEPMHIPVTYANPFPPGNVEAIQGNALGLFFYGAITYEDIYGRGHTTNFRAIWAADRNTFSSCEKGNDAD